MLALVLSAAAVTGAVAMPLTNFSVFTARS